MALLRGLIRPANCREYYLRWSMESPLVAAILTNRLTNAQAKSMDHMGTNVFDTLVVILIDICGCGTKPIWQASYHTIKNDFYQHWLTKNFPELVRGWNSGASFSHKRSEGGSGDICECLLGLGAQEGRGEVGTSMAIEFVEYSIARGKIPHPDQTNFRNSYITASPASHKNLPHKPVTNNGKWIGTVELRFRPETIFNDYYVMVENTRPTHMGNFSTAYMGRYAEAQYLQLPMSAAEFAKLSGKKIQASHLLPRKQGMAHRKEHTVVSSSIQLPRSWLEDYSWNSELRGQNAELAHAVPLLHRGTMPVNF